VKNLEQMNKETTIYIEAEMIASSDGVNK